MGSPMDLYLLCSIWGYIETDIIPKTYFLSPEIQEKDFFNAKLIIDVLPYYNTLSTLCMKVKTIITKKYF